MHKTVRLSVLASAVLVITGLSVNVQAQQAPQSPNMTFFVTSAGSGKGGDLGGLEGADAHCQQLAQRPGAGSKTWHAYLSTKPPRKAARSTPAIASARAPGRTSRATVIAQNVDDLHGDDNKLSKRKHADRARHHGGRASATRRTSTTL